MNFKLNFLKTNRLNFTYDVILLMWGHSHTIMNDEQHRIISNRLRVINIHMVGHCDRLYGTNDTMTYQWLKENLNKK